MDSKSVLRRYAKGQATIVPVSDVARSISFYVDVLGFEKREQTEDGSYGLVSCGDVGLILLGCDDERALAATRENISIYIWVDGVDACYQELFPALTKLPEGRVRAPFDQPYGMREFHVKDPDGCLLFFGDGINSRAS